MLTKTRDTIILTGLVMLLALLMSMLSTYIRHNHDRKQKSHHLIITYADGRSDGGIRVATKNKDDIPGNIFVFDQKLLDEDMKTVIGRNAGYCIRTDPGAPGNSGPDHPDLPDDPENNYGQCNWTLVFDSTSGHRGSLVVSGREADEGSSTLAIIGGTGQFDGATGTLTSTPMPLNNGEMLFRQELAFE